MSKRGIRPEGFASGSFHSMGLEIGPAMELNASVGGSAFEITFDTIDDLQSFRVTDSIRAMRDKLRFLSVRLPIDLEAGYDSRSCEYIGESFGPLARILAPDVAVIPVSLVREWSSLVDIQAVCAVHVSIENADYRMSATAHIPVLLDAAERGFGLEFDVAHARSRIASSGETLAKWDSLFSDGQPLLRALSHIHASSNTPDGNRHRVLGDPAEHEIVKMLSRGHLAFIPLILEGPFTDADVASLHDELALFA